MIAEELADRISLMLDAVIEQGFERPLYFACIGVNGQTIEGSSDVDGNLQIKYPEEGTVPTPIHILMVDSPGRAAHLTIDPPQSEPMTN